MNLTTYQRRIEDCLKENGTKYQVEKTINNVITLNMCTLKQSKLMPCKYFQIVDNYPICHHLTEDLVKKLLEE